MRIDVVTIFPGFFASPLATSMLARAAAGGLVEFAVHDLRRYCTDRHHTVDDTPFGGGGGMVLKAQPVLAAWRALGLGQGHSIYLTADGMPLSQAVATRLSLERHLVLLCGHYKGLDERARRRVADEELSVGDYVLTGGEPAALVLMDAVVRLIPGVLGNFASALEDSFQEDLLDCPWYTRPAEFDGEGVPEVLLGGNHREVQAWRRRAALRRTFERRPELLAAAELTDEERRLVQAWSSEGG